MKQDQPFLTFYILLLFSVVNNCTFLFTINVVVAEENLNLVIKKEANTSFIALY